MASIPPLMLVRSLDWRTCHYSSKVGEILPKVAFLATVVAPAVTLHTWASVPQVGTSTDIAL